MNATTKFLPGVCIFVLSCAAPSWPQTGGATLSGVITGPSGAAVANARISAKNSATGQATETQTDSLGQYHIPKLAPGDYEVSVSAPGFGNKAVKVTIPAGASQKLDLALAAAGALSLGDLGFSPQQVQGNAQAQARLDKRSHMLLIHQRLGLITMAPLLATFITAAGAGGRHGTAGGRELHAALGSVTAGMYLTTAGFAIFAPKVPGASTRAGPSGCTRFWPGFMARAWS